LAISIVKQKSTKCEDFVTSGLCTVVYQGSCPVGVGQTLGDNRIRLMPPDRTIPSNEEPLNCRKTEINVWSCQESISSILSRQW